MRKTDHGRKRYKPEEIVSVLRQAEVLHGQGLSMVDAIRQLGIVQNVLRHEGPELPRGRLCGGEIHPGEGSPACDDFVADDGLATVAGRIVGYRLTGGDTARCVGQEQHQPRREN